MYKSCKNILIALLFGNYLSIKKDWMNIIFLCLNNFRITMQLKYSCKIYTFTIINRLAIACLRNIRRFAKYS